MEGHEKIINNDYHYGSNMPTGGGYGMGLGGGLVGLIVGALLGKGFLNNGNSADVTATIQSAIQSAMTTNSIGQLGLQTANQTGDLQQSMNYNSQIASVNQNVNEGFAGLRAENLTNAVNSGFAGLQASLCSGFAGVNATVNSTSNNILAAVNNVNNSVMMEACKTQQAILNQTQVITSKMDANTISLLQAELLEAKTKCNNHDFSNSIAVNVGNTVTGSVLTALKAMGTK
jgi:hypothetical protein